MATTPIEVYYDPGKTLTVDIFPRGSDTASVTGRSLTEETNRDGVYKCNVTETLSGYYTVHVLEGTRKRAIYDIYLADDTGTKYAQSVGDALIYLYLINVNTPMANNVSSIKTKTDQLAFTTANQVNARVFTNSDKTGYSISGAKTTLDALNDVSTAQVNAEVDTALADYDAPTNAEMTAAFTEIKGATWSTNDTLEAIRDRGDAAWTTADVSSLATSAALATVDANVDAILVDTGATIPAQISALNDFNPATDTVAHVTLVDTTTTNTDMRGTDSAFLAASAPTNFGDLAITATTGLVSVGTNNDKTGYSISGTLTTLDALDTAQDSQHATTQSAISGLNDLSAAEVNAQVDTALSDYDPPTAAEMTAAFTEIKGATWSSTTDTLEAIRDRGDAAWVTADVSALATSAALATVDANVDSILVDTGTSIPATLTTILADTNELQTNQGNWTTADVSGLATAAALATVDANVDAILVDTGTTIPAQITALNDISAADVNAQVDIALSDYDGPTNAEMTAAFTEIKGATWATTDTLEQIRDNVGGGGGGDATAANQTTIINAIAALNDISAADVIGYDMGNGRTVAEALAPLRNKWTLASNVYTVYDTDDTTVLWTAAQVQTAGDPTSSMDPA